MAVLGEVPKDRQRACAPEDAVLGPSQDLLDLLDNSRPDLSERAGDDTAEQEANAFANDEDIEKDGRKREHGRDQKFRTHLNHAVLVIFWVFTVCTAAAVAVTAMHFLFPESWLWLNEKQLDKVQTFLLTALFSSALTGYVNKRMT